MCMVERGCSIGSVQRKSRTMPFPDQTKLDNFSQMMAFTAIRPLSIEQRECSASGLPRLFHACGRRPMQIRGTCARTAVRRAGGRGDWEMLNHTWSRPSKVPLMRPRRTPQTSQTCCGRLCLVLLLVPLGLMFQGEVRGASGSDHRPIKTPIYRTKRPEVKNNLRTTMGMYQYNNRTQVADAVTQGVLSSNYKHCCSSVERLHTIGLWH
ncbi:hypothetical protein BJ546DRAFT_353392 [Cryomyces antarcticus]